jgi:PLD-like domain
LPHRGKACAKRNPEAPLSRCCKRNRLWRHVSRYGRFDLWRRVDGDLRELDRAAHFADPGADLIQPRSGHSGDDRTAAHDRGVDVKLVADRRDLREGLDALAAAGILVWIDARVRIAHEKAIVVDRRVTIEGSYNFSAGAARNSEDLNVVTSPEVAAGYAAHWRARQAISVRFADAADWCAR